MLRIDGFYLYSGGGRLKPLSLLKPETKYSDPKVLAALDSIRQLHRNPLMHPEESLETVDDAIALHGAVHSVVVHMLKAIK